MAIQELVRRKDNHQLKEILRAVIERRAGTRLSKRLSAEAREELR